MSTPLPSGGTSEVCTEYDETAPVAQPNKTTEINFTPQIPFGDTITSDDIKAGAGIAKYTTNVYKYAVSIVGILAAIVLMWGGVRWLTAGGNQEAVGDAKKWIEGALSGLVLVMTSYMILYFVNPDLTTFKLIKITPIEEKVTPEVARVTKIDTSTILTGIGRKRDCVGSEFEGCVRMDNLQPSIINVISNFCKNLPPGECYITGAGEAGHTTGATGHDTGNKIDLRLTPTLTNYIEKNFTPAGTRSDKAIMYLDPKTNNCYALESNHWDIQGVSRGCP
ncbi:pilin [Patescibacteria group bacterium]|nr:pilin [Patescibacteria group bacterium]MBU4432596.1 pilin [Patescibacteria group bacterium]